MRKLKILGNPSPEVGVKELYSIGDFFKDSNALSSMGSQPKNAFEDQIKWSIWVNTGSDWKKMTQNNKTGTTVDYTFYQQSLKRKAIRMLVDINGEKAVLDIEPQPTKHAKIVGVQLLDANYEAPKRPFAYNDTIIARVNCVDMELLQVQVTLWEDDGGKNDKDTRNLKIDIKKGNVINGKADVAFKLDASYLWLANARQPKGGEGKFHEYYVTAEIFEKVSKRKISRNVDVINPDDKPAPAPPAAKKPTPAEQKGPSKKQERGIAETIGKTVHDWFETAVSVLPEMSTFNPIEIISSFLTVNIGDPIWNQNKCVCKDYDLIWGNKVSCEFRKKVIEICKELWPSNYLEMANNLMAVMAWETGESFSPSVKNPKSTATGLIQFMESTASKLKTTTAELANMTAVKQLDYVKKYFMNLAGQKLEFVDFYLQVLFPASMGKPDNHVVFSEDGKGLDPDDRNYSLRIEAYKVNKGFDTNPKYGNNDGMVTKGEIKKGIQIYIDKGKLNKNIITCSSGEKTEEKATGTDEVMLHFEGQTANENSLSLKTKNILKEVGKESKNYHIYITSTARNTYDQARIMYENCDKNGGVAKQKEIYANAGDQVIDVYVNEKKTGKTKDEIIISMENKIKELGPSNVSKHIADFKVMNTLDVSYTRLTNKKDFLKELQKRKELDKVLIENDCYHIQINQ